MEHLNMYNDISDRTGGNIYIGVIGPVRTGKSTFIKKFMEKMVIPNIDNVYKRERAKDELPQSGSGKTIMTAEPKFVPEEAAELNLENGGTCKIRMVDCVGYLVNGAIGHLEEDKPRMVSTPWNEEPIPMEQAAELGTKKVIEEHSTIGLVITTDGTITDINRDAYIQAEDRVINELKSINKPFLVVLNSRDPNSEQAKAVKKQIEDKHNVSVIALNCMELDSDDISNVISSVLYEFPIKEIEVSLPKWVSSLPAEHKVKNTIYEGILSIAENINKMRDVQANMDKVEEIEYISASKQKMLDLGKGKAKVEMFIPSNIFYEIAGEETGLDIKDEADIIPLLSDLSKIKKQYMRYEGAFNQVKQTGYGIVLPSMDELTLEEPEIIKQGGRYGVKLSAKAPSIHLIQANIQTEVTPVVGTEKQSEELIQYLLSDFDEDPSSIWESNIFGKSLSELVSEGLNNKLSHMPEDARSKVQETLEKIINEGSGGLICIIL